MVILTLLAVSPLFVQLMLNLERENNISLLKNERKYNKKFLIICGVLITFVMGFRGMLSGSPDTAAYSKFFSNLWNRNNLWDYLGDQLKDKIWLFSEIGFNAFMWLLSRISTDPQLLIFGSSAFIVYSVMRFIYKNSKDVMLSVILFLTLGLFAFSMNGMRQAMAMAICLWSYEHVKKEHFFRFLLTVFIAMFFHKTAIVFSIVYFIKFLKFDTKSVIFFLGCLAFFVIMMPAIVRYLDDIYDKNYIDSGARESGGIAQMVIYIVVLALSVIFKRSLREDKGKNYLYLVLLAFFFFLLRFIGSQIFERLSYYFSYFIILFVPTILQTASKQDKRVFRLAFIVLSILLFVYRSNVTFSNFYLCF